MTQEITKWFATDVDRCFETGLYGNGTRLYYSSPSQGLGYIIIKGISYDEVLIFITSPLFNS